MTATYVQEVKDVLHLEEKLEGLRRQLKSMNKAKDNDQKDAIGKRLRDYCTLKLKQ